MYRHVGGVDERYADDAAREDGLGGRVVGTKVGGLRGGLDAEAYEHTRGDVRQMSEGCVREGEGGNEAGGVAESEQLEYFDQYN